MSRAVHQLVEIAIAFAAAALVPGASASLPSCLPPVVSKTVIEQVQKNGTLRLRGGREVKLEGLLLALGERTSMRAGLMTVGHLVSGVPVVLRARRLELDRYRRLRAQVVLPDGRWLQALLLQEGLARASVAPDRPECARELYHAEAEARAAGKGLWADSAFRIREPQDLHWSDLGRFEIVEGKVVEVKVSGGRAYLNFGENWRTDFTISISPEDLKTFRKLGVDAYGYRGKRVRVRGYVDHMNGFEIEAASPSQIEVLPSLP